MDVAAGGERPQDREVSRRQPREPEQREPRGQVEQARLGREPGARRREPLGGAGQADPCAQPAPQLRLPVAGRAAGRPGQDELGPVQRVAVEQLGQVAHAAEPARAPQARGRVAVAVAAEVRGQRRRPWLVQRGVDHVEQRPDHARGQPGIGLGREAGGGGHRVPDERARRREGHVGAHAEPVGDPLREPALHAARRHGDHLGRERILERGGEQPAQGRDEAVGALGSMDVEHPDRMAGMNDDTGAAFEGEVLIRRLRWASEESGFAVVDAEHDGDDLVLVGPLAHLEARERVRVRGVWQDDHRFGLQIRVAAAEPLPPSGDAALLAYLRRVRHVGPARAARLLERHGADVLAAIDHDPHAALRAAGLNPRRTSEAVRSWHALRSTRALHLLLAPHGLAWLVPRIAQEHGDRAHQVVRERPYELTSVFGVGFRIADAIARAGGAAADAPARARAGVLHVLAEAERDGSTCLPAAELAARAGELLGAAPDPGLLAAMAADGALVLDADADDAVWAYRPETAALEAELAAQIRALARGKARLAAPEQPPDAAATAALVPAPEQWAAVRNGCSARLSVVTGGPGTGKTATIRLLCAAAGAQGASVTLVAPTGRAARRMAESTGAEATTIHAALGWVPGQGPTVDELGCDLLIVDETSMANLELLVTLLRAVGPRTHVVLVGDADQLAPVGAGKPFAELIAAGAVPVARLTHIFRQAAGSMIVRGAHAVRAGEAPSFAADPGLTRDLFLVERPDPRAALEEIVSLVCERLPAHYGVDPLADLQVFSPVYRGALGIDALNARLRAALNPDGRPVLGGRLRIGDKLMLSGRNLHELGLMNGTVLRLLDHREDDEVLVVAADGVTIRLPEAEAPRLQLAYACSVHKGQGIELPVALVVAHSAAGAWFLRREMLYTAMTRARTATLIVGERAAVVRAAATPDTARRHARLGARLTR